jgi:ATP-binding cassette, subfamily B, bacterial PglK
LKTIYPNVIKGVWENISKSKRKRFILISIFAVFVSFSEVIGIGMLMPFVGVLTSPVVVYEHEYMGYFNDVFGVSEPDDLLLPITILLVITAFISMFLKSILLSVQTRFGYSIGADIGYEMYRRTLYQPLSVHISKNSSDVFSGIFLKTNEVVSHAVLPILTITSSMLMLLALTALLVTINLNLTILLVLFLLCVYGGILLVVVPVLTKNSAEISIKSNMVVKSLQEGLGGIRDVIIDRSQEFVSGDFHVKDLSLRKAQGTNVIVSGMPKFIIETLIIVLFAVLSYLYFEKSHDVLSMLPVLSVIVMGLQKLLPVVHQIYNSLGSINSRYASIVDVFELLEQSVYDGSSNTNNNSMSFDHSIHVDRVFYRYSKDTPYVINGLSLNITKGSRIGFTGTTGSGKSTLLDIVMGFLEPTGGEVRIDGHRISQNNYQLWQKNIAHVPQEIFLADLTIAQNIAFGIPISEIDLKKVKHAAEMAKISDTINALDEGYQTKVGERGVRLSGGQRQRLGIARAFYKYPKVIVLDEATSALDSITERSVMESIRYLDSDITILIIAHRHSTLSFCDTVVEIDNGCIKKTGTYRQMCHSL